MFAGCKQKINQSKTKSSELQISGEKLFNDNSCYGCHSIDGSDNIGPPLNGIFGKTVDLVNGGPRIVDEQYLYESIVEPSKDFVKGYPGNMASYDYLSEDEVNALVEYIKNLGN